MKPRPEATLPPLRGALTSAPEALRAHAGSRGPFRIQPRLVAAPLDVADLQRLVRWARDEGRSLVPRGAGTGMPGGNVGPDVVVDLDPAFRWIGSVDVGTRRVRVGAGAVAADVERIARAHGLRFPPLPSSARWATIGGMLAANAAGARTLAYGATDAWVESVEVVLADGRVVELGPEDPDPLGLGDLDLECPPGPAVRKNSSGYALERFARSGASRDLLIGSEGTLGIVSSATLRLLPSPDASMLAAVSCPNAEAIDHWCGWARESGASTCELLGSRLLTMMRLDEDPELGPLARAARAVLLVEFEGSSSQVTERARALDAEARRRNEPVRTASLPEAATELWELRHRASPIIQEAAARGLRSMQFVEDSAVPPERLVEYLDGIDRILREAETDGVVFGHAGDAHIHVNPLVNAMQPDWRDRVRSILEHTVELVALLGGTLAGEHGDGRVRAPFLQRIWGAQTVDRFDALKRHLDPDGVLNPGVILPLPGQDPLEGLSVPDPH